MILVGMLKQTSSAKIRLSSASCPCPPKRTGGDLLAWSCCCRTHVQRAHSTSSTDSDDSESDSGSSCSGSPSTVQEVQWLLSKGRQGHLHLCKPLHLQTTRCFTRCNRGLRDPEVGVGFVDAFSAGKPWSPRCFQALSPDLQKAWENMGQRCS